MNLKEIYGNALISCNKFHPIIKNGYKLYFTIDLPILIKNNSHSKKSLTQNIKINIFMKNNQEILIELNNDKDLFFNYIAYFDINTYNKFKITEGIITKFQNFSEMFKEILEEIKNESDIYSIEVVFRSENSLSLLINQNLKCKEILLFKIVLNKLDDEEIKETINFKFSLYETRSKFIKNKINSIYSIIKEKNPNIILNFN